MVKTKNDKVLLRLLFILIISALLLGLVIIFTRPVLIEMIGEEEITLCYKDEYKEEGANVKYNLGSVKVTGEVDTAKIGDYEIIYSFLTEQMKRIVHVVDLVPPEIQLSGSEKLIYVIGDEYVEYGCTAWDEVDGDLSDNIQVDLSGLDMTSEGSYYVSYVVYDNSGNGARVRRVVDVYKDGPLTQNWWEFNLLPFYEDVVCKEVAFDSEKYEGLWWLGDSFVGNLGAYGLVPFARIFTKSSISSDDLLTVGVHVRGDMSGLEHPYNALDYFKPQALLILFNCDWTGRWTPEYLNQSCDRLFGELSLRYPEMKFIICSIPPCSVEFNSNGTNRNRKIDKMNAYLCGLCRKHDFKFMNASEPLRNPSTGACYDSYISGDMIHLNYTGDQILVDYVKNHLDY